MLAETTFGSLNLALQGQPVLFYEPIQDIDRRADHVVSTGYIMDSIGVIYPPLKAIRVLQSLQLIALNDQQICWFDAENLQPMAQEICRRHVLEHDVLRQEMLIKILLKAQRSDERVAAFFEFWTDRYGSPLPFELRHRLIAASLLLTRVTATRAIQRLKGYQMQDGIISIVMSKD